MNLENSNGPSSERSSQSSTQCNSFRRSDVRDLISLYKKGFPLKVILKHLEPDMEIPDDVDDATLLRMIISLIEQPSRKKLTEYNTIEDAVELIKNSHNIMVLSGAGVSTSAGIPDFRSRNGIYVTIHAEYPDLVDPKAMFDIQYFRQNPLPFYRFAKTLYPGQFEPTIGHKFIKCIEDHDKLLRNYTQNIDTLERQAKITRVVECHGSFAKASCTNCKYCVEGEVIKNDIMEQKIPQCLKCQQETKDSNGASSQDQDSSSRLAVMKPNIVFFGEQLSDEFHNALGNDKEALDLLIVIGSSLKVRPVALIPQSVPPDVPQILINKEPLDHFEFDIELLGDCDEIIQELCLRLGDDWSNICKADTTLMTEIETLSTNMRDTSNVTEIDDASTARTIDVEPEVKSRPPFCKTNQQIDEENSAEQVRSESPVCDDDDWEDVEVMHSSSESLDSYGPEKPEPVAIPKGCYINAQPGKYLFHGAELTRSQHDSYMKDKLCQ